MFLFFPDPTPWHLQQKHLPPINTVARPNKVLDSRSDFSLRKPSARRRGIQTASVSQAVFVVYRAPHGNLRERGVPAGSKIHTPRRMIQRRSFISYTTLPASCFN